MNVQLNIYATLIYAILEWSDRQMQNILIGLSDKHQHQQQFQFQQNQFIVTWIQGGNKEWTNVFIILRVVHDAYNCSGTTLNICKTP